MVTDFMVSDSMTTAIVYFSRHHGNTKKLLDAIKEAEPAVDLIDVTAPQTTDLSAYDRIGFASGIYYSSFAFGRLRW